MTQMLTPRLAPKERLMNLMPQVLDLEPDPAPEPNPQPVPQPEPLPPALHWCTECHLPYVPLHPFSTDEHCIWCPIPDELLVRKSD